MIGVAVVYDVGIRSEPEGRTGFAHLFEHLMFQGSENLEKLAHFRHVQGAGGTFNGSTHLDYTDYFETLPSNALERALFLEADRMRGPRLTEENLRNQVDVVKEEIRVNVLNRPYGGFPWLKLPPVMFDTFPNAHDGYGSFVDLESATVADAADFFAQVLRGRQRGAARSPATSTSTDGDRADRAALRRRAGPAGAGAARLRRARPDRRAPRVVHRPAARRCRRSPRAWRVPDPIDDFAGYLPYVVLAEVLTDGDASRLVRRLVLQRPHRSPASAATSASWATRSTSATRPRCCCRRTCRRAATSDKVLRTVDEECDRLATDGLDDGELARTAGPDGHPPAARHRRGARPGAAAWRCWSSSAATPALLNELPAAARRGDRGAGRARPRRRCGRTAAPSVEVVAGGAT